MTPTNNYSLQAVAAQMITGLTQWAQLNNQAAVSNYNTAMANYPQNAATDKALGLPIPPAPQPPMLMIVDSNAITQTETNFPVPVPQPSFFQYIQYVPIPNVPAVPANPLSIAEAIPQYPGFYEVNGDGPAIPVGTSFDENGATYKKVVISHSPFAPNDQVTAWQQIL
jgi:hypothetical protein